MADQDIESKLFQLQDAVGGAEDVVTAPPSTTLETAAANEPGREVAMVDGPADASSPATQHLLQGAAARTGTPIRHTAANGERLESSSRAASAHPETSFTLPTEAPPNGAPVRQYINSKLTGPLLEGMKMIAKDQPRDPLRVLGEYLLQRSKELEGTK